MAYSRPTWPIDVESDDGPVTVLADSVLPLIRTRTDLHRWSASSRHGTVMHEAIDLLEAAIDEGDAVEVHTVTHKALNSAVKVIARADDSGGIIGDACRRLLELHPRTAVAAHASPARLVDWMIAFQFDGDVDYFELDPVAYAPALGARGMTAYRARLDEIRTRIGDAPDDRLDPRTPYRHERWVLSWNDRRLAVLDRDVAAIIRTHAQDRRIARWFHDTAVALDEVGETELAIDWARQGTEMEPVHQALECADLWCRLLAEHSPDDVLAARRTVFDRWPTSSTAARLHEAAGATWTGLDQHVMATLAPRPWEAVSFALNTLRDARRAWNLAHDLGLDSDQTWASLVKAYETIDPVATVPVHTRLVELELTHADAKHYRNAARRLARMRSLAAGTGNLDVIDHVDQLVADLRETHRRRPRLHKEFDRAGLP